MKNKTELVESLQRTAEEIEEAIVTISTAMNSLATTRLKEEVIVTLLARTTKMNRSDIETVIEHIQDLEKYWLKPKKQS